MVARVALDLELNVDGINPCEDIIQIGYSIFETTTGERLYVGGGDYVQINKPLYPYITTLTGITQWDVDNRGVSFQQAYDNLVAKCVEYNVFRQLVTWGNDREELLEQFNNYYPTGKWMFGRSSCNTKPMFQAMQIQRGVGKSGGLKKSLNKLGVLWIVFKDVVTPTCTRQRSAHDARCDADNTVSMYLKLMSNFNVQL